MDVDNQKKISHLVELQALGELKIFGGDLTEEGCFDAPIKGCDLVFHVATPVNFASQDPEVLIARTELLYCQKITRVIFIDIATLAFVDTQNDMIKPAIQGVLNVLKSCAKAKTVKRVVLTSSAAAVSINTLNGTGLVLTEEDWTDTEFLSTKKPPTWVFPKL